MTEKYYIHEDGTETRESIALLCIANELAEANRLKRLELINTLPDRLRETPVSEDTINGTDKNEVDNSAPNFNLAQLDR
jgi:hypothetical protein